MTREIVVVLHAPDEGPGRFAPALEAAGGWRGVRAFAGERVPRGAEGLRALLVMGGPPSAYDASTGPWMPDVMRLVRRAHAARVPVLGVCLGAQLVAHALGGRATPGDGPEVGFAPVDLLPAGRDDPVLAPVEGAEVLHLHHDTYVPPPGAARLASGARYAEQAFRVGRSTYGVQFHVELEPEALARVVADDPDLPAMRVDPARLVAEARVLDARLKGVAAAMAEAWLATA